MTRALQRPTRLAWGVLLAVCVVASFAWTAPAFAKDEEPPAAAEEAQPAAGETLDIDALERKLLENPVTAVAVYVCRFLPLVIGIVLLVLWYLKRDKIRGGMLPAPAPVETTRPFGVWMALGLTVLGMILLPVGVMIILAVWNGWTSAGDIPTWAMVAVSAAGSIPVAVYVVHRRRTLASQAPGAPAPPPLTDAYPQRDGGGPGTPAPRLGQAFGLGGWALCVAALAVLPVQLAWLEVMDAFALERELQDVVKQVVEPGAPPHDAWLIAVFGVLVAPFVEETIFRGMLYPAAKRAFGGGRRGMWVAAFVVSLIFAAIHANWFALLPLFALALVLTWVFETTNSLAAVVIAHALHNFLSLVPMLLFKSLP